MITNNVSNVPAIGKPRFFTHWKRRLLILLAVFGPATITAMADNDAGGVATYSVAGATLGYPILFILFWATILLAITQEMGMRLTVVSRKGLADLIRERFGIRIAVFIFGALFIANMGTILVDLSAVKTVTAMFNLPETLVVICFIAFAFLFITKGSYKLMQNTMLITCLFYLLYIFSAIKANPDWTLALSNIVFPHGIEFTPEYWKAYIIIGLGVIGTTITPWGQFFISSFAYDKKIDPKRLRYSQLESYWGAFLTNFFSFFMIVATAATLFVNRIVLTSGEQAAMAIKPFAGDLAGTVFAIGIINAGFMGVMIVGLSTTYAFSEFFGYTGSLDASFKKGRGFYGLFLFQLVVAGIILLFVKISIFQIAIITQAFNAMVLPLVFLYLIRLTNNPEIMGVFVNSKFKRNFATIATIVICIASFLTILFTVFGK